MSEEVNIKLSKDEALVLFEFLSRYSDSEMLNIEHQSEARALWNLASIFEKELAEPLKKEYGELLEAARERLRDDIE